MLEARVFDVLEARVFDVLEARVFDVLEARVFDTTYAPSTPKLPPPRLCGGRLHRG